MNRAVPSERAAVASDADGKRSKTRGGGTPCHVAIIMDGNGRWAKSRGMPRVAGHHSGAKAVRRCVEAAIDQGVEWLTLFAFSSENWRRPEGEVMELTSLLKQYLRSEVAELAKQGVCFRVIGDRARFSPELRAEFDRAERETAGNHRLNLTVALSYGGRDEIVKAARNMAHAVQAGTLDVEAVDEQAFGRFLWTAAMPDPDLLIRTSGERRLSNFLLWQCAYAELVFMDVLWPDFDAAHLALALADFARRDRRYGASVG
ncbi:isoprenyl transferase [Acidisoma cellulosilytica]|uniref:Isoprenyl transferase n=2 Tax=Acidisoma cellulosilyticum TaxID=2802395 RepID=A0A963Z268_9PROT|nr:isoprenyl transferase [Acidisoma cellulosilyticum]